MDRQAKALYPGFVALFLGGLATAAWGQTGTLSLGCPTNLPSLAYSNLCYASPSSVTGVSPFLLRPNYVTNAFFVPYTISKNEYEDLGYFGPLDLPGVTPPGASLEEQMINGCGCIVSVGQVITEVSGNTEPY